MTLQVWKFELEPGLQGISMPSGARVLYAAEQRGNGVLYALVDPAAPKIRREVFVAPTGADFDPGGSEPAGLIAINSGSLMFHVFVWPERPHA